MDATFNPTRRLVLLFAESAEVAGKSCCFVLDATCHET